MLKAALWRRGGKSPILLHGDTVGSRFMFLFSQVVTRKAGRSCWMEGHEAGTGCSKTMRAKLPSKVIMQKWVLKMLLGVCLTSVNMFEKASAA